MGKWATSRLTWLDEQASREKADSESFREQRALLRSEAQVIWGIVREALEHECTDLNKGSFKKVLDFEVCAQTQARIRNLRTCMVIEVQFDLDRPQILWTCGARKGRFTFKPESAFDVGVYLGTDVKTTTQHVIEKILDTVLGKPTSDFTPPPPFDQL